MYDLLKGARKHLRSSADLVLSLIFPFFNHTSLVYLPPSVKCESSNHAWLSKKLYTSGLHLNKIEISRLKSALFISTSNLKDFSVFVPFLARLETPETVHGTATAE